MGRRRKPKVRTVLKGLPPYVHKVTNKDKDYFYFRRQFPGGGCIRRAIAGVPFDGDGIPVEAWWATYEQLGGVMPPDLLAGTFKALIVAFKRSGDWKRLAETTQRQYAERLGVLEKIWGKVQVKDIRPKHVRQLRDKFVDTPSQADHLITVLSSMLSWGVVDEWLEMNPCLGMRKLKFGCDGSYEAWDAGMVELFKRQSLPHMWWAAALALYTGQRRADCLNMRWTDYRNGLLYVKQSKTKKRLGIPMHKELAKVWEVLPRTSEYVLATTTGRQWTNGNFGTVWHRQMRRPEFASFREQRLTFHGLRHTAVNALLEAGCTTAQVQAITGQTSEMVEHYAKQVDQEKLARQAIAKVEAASDARAAERGELDRFDGDGQGWLFDIADIA